MIKFFNLKNLNSKRGMTIFIAVSIMAILLFITFAVVNITIKSTLFASYGRESQLAFYASDAGMECALYWDSKDPTAFDTGAIASWKEMHAVEYSGIDPINPLDKVSGATGMTNGNNPQTVSSGSQFVNASAVNKQLIFGYADEWINTSYNVGAGFTRRSDQPGFKDMVEDKSVSSPGNYDAFFRLNNPSSPRAVGSWAALMATFKAVANQNWAYEGRSQAFDNTITIDDTTSGNLVVITIQYNSEDFNIVSMDDDKGNVYQKATSISGYTSNNGANTETSAEIWYGIITTGGDLTISAHSPAFVPQIISCNGQSMSGLSITTDVANNPAEPHRIGGQPAKNNPTQANTSIFQLNFTGGSCAIVTINKNIGVSPVRTHIESHGFNTCDTSNPRRVERGIEVTYPPA